MRQPGRFHSFSNAFGTVIMLTGVDDTSCDTKDARADAYRYYGVTDAQDPE